MVAELADRCRVRALLVSGDDEPRHLENLRTARRALIARGFADHDIESVSPAEGTGTKRALEDALRRLARATRDGDGWLLYLTGHGAKGGLLLSDGVVSHRTLLRWLAPLSQKRAVVVLDGCYSGGLPWQLLEAGFDAYAMAPVTRGHTSYCQLFAPQLWQALERGLDSDGDGTPSFREAFRFALGIYQQKLKEAQLPIANGAWARPLPELSSVAQLERGAALVELSSLGCQPCAVQRRRLAMLSALLDDVALYTVDVGRNPHAGELSQLDGMPALDAVPTLLLVRQGRVVRVRRGLTDTATLLADAHEKLGARRSLNATVASLRADLDSADGERVRFALQGLLELGRARADTLRVFRRMLSQGDTATLIPLVEAVASSRGYAALHQALRPAEKRALLELFYARRRQTMDEALEGLASRDDATRGVALLELWRLASAGDLDPAALAPMLAPLAKLQLRGDDEQRRLAMLLLETSAPRFADAELRFAFDGAEPGDSDALSRALSAWQPATLLVYGSMAIEANYADRGNLQASASPTASRFEHGTLTLSFAVRPGPRYRIRAFSTLELGARDQRVTPLGGQERLDALASMPPGSVASRLAIAERIQAVQAHYQNAGYAEANVVPQLDMRADGTCDVTLRVQRGELRHFGRVRVSGGAAGLRSRVRASVGIRAGELYRLARLEAARKRVLSLVAEDRVAFSTSVASDGRVDVAIEIQPPP